MSVTEDFRGYVRKAYDNHQQWAERLHQLYDRLIQLNTETAACLRDISTAERNEQLSHQFVRETFDNYRAMVLASPDTDAPEALAARQKE